MALPRRLHRVRTGRRVPPWNDPVGELPILGRSLREAQDRAAAAVGLRFGEDVDEPGRDDALYWDEDLMISGPALRAWARRAEAGSRMALLERPARVGELEVEPAVDLEGPARLVGLRWGEGSRPLRVPPFGLDGKTALAGPAALEIPWYVTARTAVTVRHWSHLLRANVAALGVCLWEELVLSPWVVAWAWLRSPLHFRYARIGRGCRIHPTARIEGCWLGDGVQVGAYSVLRGSWVGDGAVIEDHCNVKMSVIGRGAHLANVAILTASVLGERSSLGHLGCQASIVGRRTWISTFAYIQDYNLRGNVRLPFEGRMVDTGLPFLGVAVGHDCSIGAAVTLAPGRAVPNGVRVVAEVNALARIRGDEAPGEYVVRDGRLVPA